MSVPPAPTPLAVFPDDRYGLIQPRGTFTSEAALAVSTALLEEPGWEAGFTEVWDLRAVDRIEYEAAALGRFVQIESQMYHQLVGSRTLIITGPVSAAAWMVKAYARAVRIFGRQVYAYDADSALRDLGVAEIPNLKGL